MIVRDGNGKDSVVIDMKNGRVTVTADKELVLACTGKLTIGGDGAKLAITGAELKISCDKVDINNGALEVS
ncbi:hypothetical protein [Nannocystis sp.]|uniref:hypothetical protein n=1 Tax=Nannocystis sp. TaxID=1962667 RepID=UPI0025E4834D|nr:hypothetical protein [Nannocystis sp.]